MFAKLLKYEWKTNARLLGTLSLCMLGVALLGALDLRAIITFSANDNGDSFLGLLLIPAILFMVFVYIALILYAGGTQFYLQYRFYKTRFTDEGYLTFTLPVKTSHIFLSSALHILIWQIIAICVLLLSIGIVVGLGIPWGTLDANSSAEAMQEFAFEMQLLWDIAPLRYYLLLIPISLISAVVLPMSAIVIGAVIAKKYKLLAAIGILYGVSTVTGVITGMISVISSIIAMSSNADMDTIIAITPLLSMILPAVLSGCGYFLSIHLMKNKLNLP